VMVSEKEFRKRALADPSGGWELHCGQLRPKPAMTFEHSYLGDELYARFNAQLDRRAYRVRFNVARLRRSQERYYIPDLCIVPMAFIQPHRGRSNELEIYVDPLPLVVEIWSPSTGEYDVESKLPEYQRRGDQEIWLLHPYDRTLRRWMRQPDGSYVESRHEHGQIQPVALPGVTIDLDTLFD
jgi:Uma2 family endonuclease